MSIIKNELPDTVEGIEQDILLKIGKNGYEFEATLERNKEGLIVEIQEEDLLKTLPLDSETYLVHVLLHDECMWDILDEILEMDVNKEIEEFISTNIFNEYRLNDEDKQFLDSHCIHDKYHDYIELYVTIIDNRVYYDDAVYMTMKHY